MCRQFSVFTGRTFFVIFWGLLTASLSFLCLFRMSFDRYLSIPWTYTVCRHLSYSSSPMSLPDTSPSHLHALLFLFFCVTPWGLFLLPSRMLTGLLGLTLRNSRVMSRREHCIDSSPPAVTYILSVPSFLSLVGIDTNVSLKGEHSAVTYVTYHQNFAPLWVSALTAAHWSKRLLWPVLRAARVYGFKYIFLEVSLITYSFRRKEQWQIST